MTELKKKLAIDNLRLEEHCAIQPALYQEVGELLESKRYEVKSLKLEIKEMRAEKETDIKVNPSSFLLPVDSKGEPKVTESSVQAIIDSDIEILKKERQLILTEKEQGELQILLEAYSERKSMLRALVDLYVSNYYSEVGTNRAEFKEVKSEQRESVKQKIEAVRKERQEQEKKLQNGE